MVYGRSRPMHATLLRRRTGSSWNCVFASLFKTHAAAPLYLTIHDGISTIFLFFYYSQLIAVDLNQKMIYTARWKHPKMQHRCHTDCGREILVSAFVCPCGERNHALILIDEGKVVMLGGKHHGVLNNPQKGHLVKQELNENVEKY
ncbi:hypothetical protein L1887_23136 [Cichorium endivia]|nr:hypothetical protein L1887_23136 [Cichorium endivia]